MKILITAFGPFNNFSQNPSEEILHELKNRMIEERFGVQIEWVVLPVSYAAVDDFIGGLDLQNDLIIHMGVASNEKTLRFEVVGQNVRSGTDIEGITYREKNIVDNVNMLSTSFPQALLTELTGVYPDSTRISTDAGAYLCNYIYFKSLLKFSKNTPVLFIHVSDVYSQVQSISIINQADIVEGLIVRYIESDAISS